MLTYMVFVLCMCFEGAPPTSQQSRTRKRTKMENYSDEERRPPSPKFSRMRSDRYEYEREKAEATRFRRDRVPRRPLEEPQRSLQPQRLRMSSKKTVRAQVRTSVLYLMARMTFKRKNSCKKCCWVFLCIGEKPDMLFVD